MVERTFHQDIRGLISASTFENAIPITPGTTCEKGACIRIDATVAGNVHLELASGDEDTFSVGVGLTVLPLAVTKVIVSGTTATASYKNWI